MAKTPTTDPTVAPAMVPVDGDREMDALVAFNEAMV